jgi:hypothetical protein
MIRVVRYNRRRSALIRVLLVSTLLMTACEQAERRTCPATVEQADAQTLFAIEEAAFHWAFGPPSGKSERPRFISVAGQRDPQDEVLRRLRERYPGLRLLPRSEAQFRENSGVTERGSEVYGSTVGLSEIDWESPTTVRLHVYKYSGDMAWGDSEIVMSCTGGYWTVTRIEREISG